MHTSQLKRIMNTVSIALYNAGIPIDEQARKTAYQLLDHSTDPRQSFLGFELLLAQKTGQGIPMIQIPFRGSLHSTVHVDESFTFHVAYSNLKLDDYLARHYRQRFRILTWSQFEDFYNMHLSTMETTPTAIPTQDFYDALHTMPPQRYQAMDNFELFHMAERITGDLVRWYALGKKGAFSWVGRMNSNSDTLKERITQGNRMLNINICRQLIEQ